jgi:hypothetical protein
MAGASPLRRRPGSSFSFGRHPSLAPRHPLVQILLPKETGSGKRFGQGWFEDLLKELIEGFGGATSFRNGTGQYCG